MKAAVLLLACLAGCADPWPQAGRGGMAERLPLDDAELARFRDRLELAADGQGEPRPGRIALAQERFLRARRENEAALHQDSAKSLAEASLLAGFSVPPSGFPERPACAVRPCG